MVVIFLTNHQKSAFICKEVHRGLLTVRQRVQAMLIEYWSKEDMLVALAALHEGQRTENAAEFKR